MFFLGWGFFARSTAGGADWYVGANLYQTCKTDWWARLLMIGNVYPYFQEPTQGCFFWGWVIDVDLQLSFFLTPIFVSAYLKRRWFGNLMVFMAICAGITINWTIVVNNKLTAGWGSTADNKMFSYLIEKPWNHIGSFVVGVYFA